jgi:hypothetical protein
MIQNKLRSISLLSVLLPVCADSVELGAQVGINFLSAPKQTDINQTNVKNNKKNGFAGRISLGYVETMDSGLFMGVHGFLGTMGGQLSVHNDHTKPGDTLTETTNCPIRQGVNTGVYGQLDMVAFDSQ